jgi:hypothetical protein
MIVASADRKHNFSDKRGERGGRRVTDQWKEHVRMELLP